MRRPHKLAPNHSSATVRHALFFDTETDQVPVSPHQVVHRLRFGWWCAVRRTPEGGWTRGTWGRFTDAAAFWAAVDAQVPDRSKLTMLCHNTAFDLAVLDPFRHLHDLGWTLKTACIDAPPTILRWSQAGRKLECLDSLNWWRTSLANIGHRVGLEKLDRPDLDACPAQADVYCRRDVEILVRAVTQWWDWVQVQDFGGAAPTLASQAMHAYRHRFMRRPIYIDNTDRANTLAREAYHGGRVECFRLGEFHTEHHLLDVNSMYPYVMQENLFPTKLLHACKSYSRRNLYEALAQYCVVAEVTLDTEEPAYPVRDGLRLYFPVGQFRAFLCTGELIHAMERGHIRSVQRVAVYECADIFTEFVEELTELRNRAKYEGDELAAHQFKILANSLYGKFGQRGLFWEPEEQSEDLTAEAWSEVCVETGAITRYRRFGGLVQAQATESESRDSMPAIAAHVTSYARMYLWSMIQQAGREHVLYTDTDSLFVDWIGRRRLQARCDEERLGALADQGRSKCGCFWGPKDYHLGFRARHKGVRKTAVWASPEVVQQEQWSGLGRSLFEEHFQGPTTRRITKRLYRHYDKGVVRPDGTVVPHRLSLAD